MAVDPATGQLIPLFHPIRQAWSDHFRFTGYEIEALTAVGRATLAALDLNHPRRQRIRGAEEMFGSFRLSNKGTEKRQEAES